VNVAFDRFSMKPIIRIQNLGKEYRLGERISFPETFRERISGLARRPGRILPRKSPKRGSFWALRNVDLDVDPGQVVGIIGRNGAGKSTLLKILSRVTIPSEGQVELFGRTNSLLEVGTGFHPELTGRENIFVNGAILGLKKREIKKLFDEIVAFAEIEKFLATAVKHYSSGMYMRLGFSVAAHLDPDILIIDEVLSVGDAQFQKKCLAKVQDVAGSGRTVLFVSHNMAAVEHLCGRGVVLEDGRITFDGDRRDAIASYLQSTGSRLSIPLNERPDRLGSGEIRISEIEIRDMQGNPLANIFSGQDIDIHFHFESERGPEAPSVTVGFMVRTHLDVPVFLQHNRLTGDRLEKLPHRGAFVCRIRKLPLPPASYRLGFSVMRDHEELDRIDDGAELVVIEGDFYGTGQVPPATHGCCLVDAEWRLVD
jgi:lipopolysaccharide transport system ATP-binding protein